MFFLNVLQPRVKSIGRKTTFVTQPVGVVDFEMSHQRVSLLESLAAHKTNKIAITWNKYIIWNYSIQQNVNTPLF